MKIKKYILLIVALLLFIDSAHSQCAMCRAVLESGEDQSVAEGINDGIVYLMAIPYILVGTIGFIVYQKFFKSKKNKIL